MDAQDSKLLVRLLALVDREDHQLLAVRSRLFGGDCAVDASRVSNLLADDLGIDRLESFASKFARMQDTIVDKLIPTVLRGAGEPVAAAIDNLDRLERLGLIASADQWLEMRGLRNRLVHEYFDRPEDLAPALERTCRLTDLIHRDYSSIREYAAGHLGIDIGGERKGAQQSGND
jgi:hypothetical protein